MKTIQLPINGNDIQKLRVGDEVQISGHMVTARDMAHRYMTDQWPDWLVPLLRDGAIYHCGPVVSQNNGVYAALSAGPTTSIREEPYAHRVIARYGPRLLIGKGGMGDKTLEAMRQHGAVYIHATGGAASVIAKSIVHIHAVHMLAEFGAPEAFWELEVENFTGVVTMDAHGGSLHRTVREASQKQLFALLGDT